MIQPLFGSLEEPPKQSIFDCMKQAVTRTIDESALEDPLSLLAIRAKKRGGIMPPRNSSCFLLGIPEMFQRQRIYAERRGVIAFCSAARIVDNVWLARRVRPYHLR
jgi:hypothetical protein